MKISDNTYVRWEHKEQKETTCVVEHNGATLTGQGKVGHGDEFRKAIGRKVSLARAIKDLTKDERRTIWNSLRNKGISFA